ncbi:MAG TPA: hypothetical protein H9805_06660 [Candidatus Janibacter merdipullorum]|nr:hypothetical protein [Candidatus Janibacter merdipullorum]
MKPSAASYQTILVALVDAIAEQVRIVVASWRAGDILLGELVDLVVGFIVKAESQAAIAAVVAVESQKPVQTITAVELPDVEVHEDIVFKAVGTVLEDLPDDPTEEDVDAFDKRLQRLAKGRVTETAGKYVDEHLPEVPEIVGYTRGLDEDPCELCVWLKKEHLRPGGFIYPAGQPMHRHPGCCCVPVPVYEKEKEA